jgi:D-alanyl-D-alanine dipeptidase
MGFGQIPKLETLPDTAFVRLVDYSDDFLYEIRYATPNNFMNQPVYECDECLMRAPVAAALIKANAEFMSKGYRIKLFDCYRPLDAQKVLWKINPNPRYVANPYGKTGSSHNRGLALDLTLVDLNGDELEMGTDYDYFGVEAHQAYANFPDPVLANRSLLREILKKYGFRTIRTEWWHYNYGYTRKYGISNFPISCDH